MQTDLQLLLVIMGLVLASYVLFIAFRKHKHKEQPQNFAHHEMEPGVFSQPHVLPPNPLTPARSQPANMSDNDPLMDETIIRISKKKPAEKVAVVAAPIAPVVQVIPAVVEPVEPKPIAQVVAMEVEQKAPPVKPAVVDFIAISIIPKPRTTFSGKRLLLTLTANQFHFGKKKTFHRYENNDPTRSSLFSVVSMVEPGSFDLKNMENEEYKGLFMLMTLPNSLNNFEKMLATARQLAASLQAELGDIRKKPLTAPMIMEYREKVQMANNALLHNA